MAVVSKSELIKWQKLLGADAAIAKKFNVTRQWIHVLRQKYGIESRYAKHSKRDKEILSLFKAGKIGREIAKKFCISISGVYYVRDKTRGKKK
jgi:FixJ family two-component response regulator